MSVLETERWAGYEAAWPGHHRQPFDGVEQYPRVITRADAGYAAWAPEDSVTQPVWCYVSTHRVNAGTFYVQPKEWFDPAIIRAGAVLRPARARCLWAIRTRPT